MTIKERNETMGNLIKNEIKGLKLEDLQAEHKKLTGRDYRPNADLVKLSNLLSIILSPFILFLFVFFPTLPTLYLFSPLPIC